MSVQKPDSIQGIVWQITGEWSVVKTSTHEVVKARLRGRLKLEHQDPDISKRPTFVAVGDQVTLLLQGEDWTIEHIAERRTYFARHIEKARKTQVMASNIDQVMVMASLCEPYVPFVFIDSVVVNAVANDITPIVLFNKSDLYTPKDQNKAKHFVEIYRSLGYEAMQVSIQEKTNTETIKDRLAGKKTLLVGFSGCGKTSLVNDLLPTINARTQDLSRQKLGQHTTTFSQMYALEDSPDTYIIDSPGIRFFSMPRMDASELRMYFPEFLSLQSDCSFVDCTHIHESGCAVRTALQNQRIADERYFTYTTNFEHLTALEKNMY